MDPTAFETHMMRSLKVVLFFILAHKSPEELDIVIARAQYSIQIYFAQLNPLALLPSVTGLLNQRHVVYRLLTRNTLDSLEEAIVFLDVIISQLQDHVAPDLGKFMWSPLRTLVQKQMHAIDEFVTVLYETGKVQDDTNYGECIMHTSRIASQMTESILSFFPHHFVYVSAGMADSY